MITRRPHKRVGPRLYRYLDTATFFVRAEGFDPRGRRVSRKVDLPPGTTLGQAMVARDDLIAAIANGTFTADDVGRVTPPMVADAFDLLEQRERDRWAPQTKRSWATARRIMAPLASMRLAAVSYTGQLAPWWAQACEGRSPGTQRWLRGWTVRVFGLAHSVGWIGSNPATLIVVPTMIPPRPVLPTLEGLVAAFVRWSEIDSAALASGDYAGWQPLYQTQLAGGFRISELLKLRWSDIDRDQMAICLRAEAVKTRRARTVPISDELLALLDLHRARLKGSTPGRAEQAELANGLVWPTATGTVMNSGRAAGAEWDAGMRAAGLEAGRANHVTPHMLRRMAVSRMMRAGVRDAVVRQIVGHRNPAMLALYDRPFADEITALRAALAAPVAVRSGEQTYSVAGHPEDTGASVASNPSKDEGEDA